MKPFTVKHIDHIVLRVRNLEASMAFYRDVLGCELKKRRDDLGMMHMAAGSSLIDLVDIDGVIGRQGGAAAGKEQRNVDHFCLRIEPFEPAILAAYLEGVGVHVGEATKRYGAEGTGWSMYCTDPDGNQLELKGPPLPAQGN
jgi:glyoxylase I family protein